MYYAVKRAYGGNTAGDNLPPTVAVPSVADPGTVPAGKEVTVQAPATDPEGDPLAYEVLWGGKYVDGGGGLVSAPSTHLGNGTLKVTAPAKTGVWKLYVKAKDGRGNVGVEQRSVRVVPPPVAGTDVARGGRPPPPPTRTTGTAAAPAPRSWRRTGATTPGGRRPGPISSGSRWIWGR